MTYAKNLFDINNIEPPELFCLISVFYVAVTYVLPFSERFSFLFYTCSWLFNSPDDAQQKLPHHLSNQLTWLLVVHGNFTTIIPHYGANLFAYISFFHIDQSFEMIFRSVPNPSGRTNSKLAAKIDILLSLLVLILINCALFYNH